MVSKEGKERFIEIDVIRCIAICCVVMCHVVVGDIYTFSIDFMNAISSLSHIFAFSVFSIGRLGVPFFLLISGYLLLDREYDDEACKKFWKNNWFGLIIAIEFWHIVYNIFNIVINNQEISIITILKEMLMLKSSGMSHMWYMPMILGMYLTLPFVANALRKVSIRTLLFPYIIITVLTFGVNTFNTLFQSLGFNLGTTIISMGFSGGTYGIYLLTGYLLKKGVLKKINSKWLLMIASFTFIAVVVMQLFAYSRGVNYNVWYDNIFLLICSITCFELISRGRRIRFKRVITFISKYSFAIYLVHNPINILLKKYTVDIASRPLRVLVIWGATILCSLGVSYLISKIPKIGKKILYMR